MHCRIDGNISAIRPPCWKDWRILLRTTRRRKTSPAPWTVVLVIVYKYIQNVHCKQFEFKRFDTARLNCVNLGRRFRSISLSFLEWSATSIVISWWNSKDPGEYGTGIWQDPYYYDCIGRLSESFRSGIIFQVLYFVIYLLVTMIVGSFLNKLKNSMENRNYLFFYACCGMRGIEILNSLRMFIFKVVLLYSSFLSWS